MLSSYPITYYSVDEVKEKFNADVAFSYSIPIEYAAKSYKKGEVDIVKDFNHYQVIVMFKSKRGRIAMHCFYNDEGAKDLEKHIAAAESIFRFRNSEEFYYRPDDDEEPVVVTGRYGKAEE